MSLVPSTMAIGKGACSVIARQRLGRSGGWFAPGAGSCAFIIGKNDEARSASGGPKSEGMTNDERSGTGGLRASSLLFRLRFQRGFFFWRRARAGARGNSASQPVVIRAPRVDDDHAFARDHIFADVFAVIAAAHFGDEKHLPQLAIDFHITHPDNVIGQKRNRVMTKRQRGKCILYFDRAQNRKPRSGQRPDQSVE